MPSLRAHCYIDRLWFGRTYPKLHRSMDRPVKYFGKKHRIFYHDYISAIAIARREYPNDPDAERAAILHIEFDRLCSADPEFRRLLETMAIRSAKQRRRIRKFGNILAGKPYKKSKRRKRKRWLIPKKKKKKSSFSEFLDRYERYIKRK